MNARRNRAAWLTPSVIAAIALTGLGCEGDRVLGPGSTGCETIDYLRSSDAIRPAWHPSGRWIACESVYNDRGEVDPGLYVVDVWTGKTTRLVRNDSLGLSGAEWPQYSPDGARLLFRVQLQIVYRDFREDAWHDVTLGERYEDFPFWSPGGDSILFVRNLLSYQEPETAGGLYISNLRTGTLERFVCADSQVTWPVDRPCYSPDGRWIAYTSAVAGPDGVPNAASEIFAVRADGSERRQLTHMQGKAAHPLWTSVNEVEFDFVPYECKSGRAARHTWSVRIDGTGLRRWPTDLVDSRIQFSQLPAIDRLGLRAAVVLLDPTTGGGGMYITRVDGTGAQRLFRRHYHTTMPH